MEKVYLFGYNYIIAPLGRNGKGVGKKNPYKIHIVEIGIKEGYNGRKTEVEAWGNIRQYYLI